MSAMAKLKLEHDEDRELEHDQDREIGAEELAFVRRCAATLVRRLPRHVALDELIARGYLGLVEARGRYHRSRGVPFAAFAAPRVRGAMLDGLRDDDPLTRSERARVQRGDGDDLPVRLVELDRAERAADDRPDAEDQLCQRARLDELGAALAGLDPRERLIVERHFFGERSLRAIGDELGVTESRVCQLVGAALRRLRSRLSRSAA